MPETALFIGHSLVGPIMPTMFNAIAGAGWEADAQVINGAPLRWGWDNGASAEGVNARVALTGGTYDAVIVTEALPLANQIIWNDTQGYAKRYYDLAVAANTGTQFYIYETWHSMGSDTAAWRAQIATDLSAWESIADHVNASAPSWASPAQIVPTGQAMGALYDAIEAGQVSGLNTIRDVFADDIHLNDIGNWFIAAVQASVVAGVDIASAPIETFSPWGAAYGGPDAAMAAAMDEVIDQTLSSYQGDGDGGFIPEPDAQEPMPPVAVVGAPEPVLIAPEPVVPDAEVSNPFAPTREFIGPIDSAQEFLGMEVIGDAQDNVLLGDASDNIIRGLAGNDSMTGQQGNDYLDGGEGWDVVIYDTELANITLTMDAAGITVQDRRAEGDGLDTLYDVEVLSYRDGQLQMSQLAGAATLSADQMMGLVELYIAYFNRAPDALGLNFWGTVLANGASLSDIASQFTTQEETRAVYADVTSTAEFISRVYNNVLGREGEAEGIAFWTNALATEAVARDQFILSVLEGAKAPPAAGMSAALVAQQEADQLYLSDKTELGAYFAVHRGLSDVNEASAVMAAYTGTGSGYNEAIGLSDLAWRGVELGYEELFLMPTVGVLETPSWW